MSESERIAEEVRSALRRVEAEFGQEIAVRWPIAAYGTSEGSVTIYQVIPGSEYCTSHRLLDVAGTGTTRQDGRIDLSLNDFHCLDRRAEPGSTVLGYDHPINVVATPRSNFPVLLTVKAQIAVGKVPQDVTITVSSWDTNGAAVGGLPFNWRCLVPITEIVT
ncbi:MAG TPA: hypothetical protein VI876_10705 [Dehalococcoidia bacterium]|nr:hypothetical protein [Dehalococcoidia bacterium]